MDTFQMRVVIEKEDLDVRIAELVAFTTSDRFHLVVYAEQMRMLAQIIAMSEYSNILFERTNSYRYKIG